MSTQQSGTARTYAFIGFIFYVIAAAAGVLGILVLSVVFSAVRQTGSVTNPSSVLQVPFFGLRIFQNKFQSDLWVSQLNQKLR